MEEDAAADHELGSFDRANYMSIEDIDAWVRETRHKVMYRDLAKVD